MCFGWTAPFFAILVAHVTNAITIKTRQDDAWWTPPSTLTNALAQTWAHEMSTYSDPLGFKNYGYDQLIATKGKIQVCVRWETTHITVTEAQRNAISVAVNKMYGKWISWLVGWDDFPYTSVPATVIAWATSNKDLLLGSTSGLDIYSTVDADGVPQCDPRCGRFFHQDGDYSQCPGGAARHYDFSLWLTEGMDGGAGGDWGMRVGLDYMLQNVNSEDIHILEHEMGHHFALDDFYDWMPDGVTNFIMNSGSSTVITAFDGWMMRDWWRHLKSRYNLATTPTSISAAKTSSPSTVKATSSSSTAKTTSSSSTLNTTSSSKPTSSTTMRSTSTKSSSSASAGVPLYGQCGGLNYQGSTQCASGTCKFSNDWYSQCLL